MLVEAAVLAQEYMEQVEMAAAEPLEVRLELLELQEQPTRAVAVVVVEIVRQVEQVEKV
jgi:hypothetical protein